MKSLPILCLSALFTLLLSVSHAQTPALTVSETSPTTTSGTVTGTLVYEKEGQKLPVQFGSVALFRTADSTAAGGVISDEKGTFKLTNVTPGLYYILIQSLGFKDFSEKNIILTADKPSLDLGTVLMTQTARELNTVTVTGQKELIEYSLDRKIINVDKLPTTLGGSALDIMQNVPSVTVDIDGNLSLRGSENVIILVDGKPSGLTGMDRQAVLDQIPASSIESIEVITNPSSKFDADGAAGILNIILKKEKADGFNGSADLNIGTRDKYNASVNLNNRINKLNTFMSYNFRDRTRFTYRDNDRDNFNNETLRYLEQRQDGTSRDVNHNLRFGFDWEATKQFQVSGSILYRPEYDRDRDVARYRYQNTGRELTQTINRTTDEEEVGGGLDYVLGLRKKFDKEGRLLTFDATLSTSKSNQLSLFNQTTTDALASEVTDDLYQRNTRENKDRVAVMQLDFVEPLANKAKLETGLKYTNRLLDGDFQFENRYGDSPTWIYDPRLSNRFIYDEHTSAAYANFGQELSKWSYQFGLRLENTDLTTEQRTTGEVATQNYTYLFPSAFLNYELNKAQKMQVNYTRRINRPWTRALNPFVDISDPLNIRFGNPNLRPELINSFELSHLWYGKSTSLTSTAFYRATTDNVTRYRRLRDDGVTEQTYLNLARSYSYGLEFVLNQDITRWWKANGNFSYYMSTIKGDPGVPDVLTQSNRSWTARINSNMTIAKGFDSQVSINYRSPFIIPQGEIQSFFNVDVGVKKEVLKGRGAISLRVSDIFNTLRFRINTYGEGFTSYTSAKRESRIAFLGFTYRFGKQAQQLQKEREERDSGMDEDY
ncbi:TonB-dependent receptor domain-containing protein [Salmonirosea aquatica]|uniref:TonB-dependent receptor n=1 Tax=Salmonirosea aquatica TaxID=2654236 RepID=A0A7C9BG66_9BACT|nr:TonB-dependent receptor [Cytophagaceae bacterium SJW1-29]